MKKNIYLGLILIFLVAIPTGLFAALDKDFGFRCSLGAYSGIDEKIRPEIGLITDFYLFSENIRMIFGPTFILPMDHDIPLTAVHALGLEYNQPIGMNQLFFGIRYFKSFLQTDSNDFGSEIRGWVGLIGYKIPLEKYQDIVIIGGIMNSPFDPEDHTEIDVKDNSMFLNVGWEWYF